MQDEEYNIDVGEADEQETEIDLEATAPEQSLEEEVDVEKVADDSQPADTSEEPAEQSDVQKGELNEYSEGVQKRIAKLTRKMREAERQKEEAIAYAKEWKCNTLQYFLRKEQSELSAILYKAVVGCMHRTYAFKAHKEIFKIPVAPNWFSPTEEWLNKYKITQLRLLAKKLDVDVLPTDNKKMVMHRLLAASSEGAEFDPIKFLEEVE